MFALLLQDWTTLQVTTTTTLPTITQTEPFWLDTSPYRDLVAFLQVAQVTSTGGNLYIAYQTSPTKDENLFTNMNDIVSSTAIAVSAGVVTALLLRDTSLCPLAHWLRWQLSPAAAVTSYQLTFRVWISASCPGRLIDPTMSDSSSVMNTGFEGDPSWSYGPTPAGGSSNQPPTTILGKNAPLTPVQMHATLPPSASGQKFMPAPFNAQKALTTLPEQTKQRAPGPSTPAFRYSQLLPNHGSFNRFLPPGTINKPQQ